MVKNIAIIGFMAVGKTTVARRLAQKLGCEAIDLDEAICEETEMSIAEIFALHGEDYFRRLEQEMLARLAEEKNIVLATGGGAVLAEKNRNLLQEKFYLVCLTSRAEVIWERVQKDGGTRPLLADSEAPLDKIDALLREREQFYRNAHCYVDTSDKSVDEIVRVILAQMEAQRV